MAPLLSIVVPSLNRVEYLEECLNSIIGQENADFELIVIDGGSNDDVLALLRRHEAHFTDFVSESDGGQADAINKGFALAKGSIFAWLNTDDFYEPGALAAIQEAYHKEPGRPFYFGNGYRTDAEGKEKKVHYPDDFSFNRELLLWGENPILQPATFMSVSVLERANPLLDPNLKYAMDTDLWVRLSQVGDPLFIDKPIANNREHEATKTERGGWERFEEIRRVAKRHTGCPLTPGALHVMLGTLHRYLKGSGTTSRFAPQLVEKLESLWEQSGLSLSIMGAPPEVHSALIGNSNSGHSSEQLKEEISKYKKVLAVLEEDRVARGKQISELVGTISDLTGPRSEQEKQIEKLTGWLKECERDRTERLRNNDKLTEMVIERDGMIEEMRKEIERLKEPLFNKLKRRFY